MSPKHICLVSARFFPVVCGVGDYTAILAHALQKHGMRVSILTRAQNCPEQLDGIPVIEGVKKWNFLNLSSLKSKLKHLAPDIVHLEYEPFGFRQSYAIPFFFSHLEIPLVTTLHEVWHRFKIHQMRDKYLYEHSRHLIVNDTGCEERLLKIAPSTRDRITKIGVGSNIPLISRVQKNKTEKIVMGTFGFINKTKLNEILLRGLAEVIFKHKRDVHLIFMGKFLPKENPYHQELFDICASLDLKNHITFTGELPALTIAKNLAQCDVAVLHYIDGASPRRGGFQACVERGLPVITTKPWVDEPLMTNGKTALFLDANTPQGLAQAIIKFIDTPNLADTLSKGGLAFSQNFTWDVIAQKHLDIYNKILS